MKTVVYTLEATRQLRRHGNMEARMRKAIEAFAVDPKVGANNVTRLVGGSGFRMRVGDFRVIFLADDATITVVKVAPRGSVY